MRKGRLSIEHCKIELQLDDILTKSFSFILNSIYLPLLINTNWSINTKSNFRPSLIFPNTLLINFNIPSFTLGGVISHTKLRSLNYFSNSNSQTISPVLQKIKSPPLPHIPLLLIKQILQTLMISENLKPRTILIVPPNIKYKHYIHQLQSMGGIIPLMNFRLSRSISYNLTILYKHAT